MKTIALIKPDIPKDAPIGKLPAYIPVGLAFLAGVLEKAGFEVVVIDNYLLEKDQNFLAREIQIIKPDLIGITCNIATSPSVAKIVEIGKQEGIPIVVGGPQVTINPERYLRRIGGDIGVVGEGELTFLELCKVLSETGSLNEQNMKKIPSLIIKINDADYLFTGRRAPMTNLDDLPFLPLHLFPYREYSKSTPEIKTTPLEILFTSRGCPYKCNFCSNDIVWGRKYRCMSAKRVVDEIEYMIKNYGTQAVYFQEDNFTVNKERVKEFCRLLMEKGIKIDWMCESRVDSVSESVLTVMRQAGCVAIFFGVESGTPRVLDFLDKGITIKQIETAFDLCRKLGIKTGASVMVGIPGQTKKENYETMRFVRRLDPDFAYFNPFVGYPGSKIYDYIINNALVYDTWEEIIFPNSEDLSWPEKVKLKERFEIEFNLRPQVLYGHLKRMGVRRFINKSVNTLSRYLKVRKSIKEKG